MAVWLSVNALPDHLKPGALSPIGKVTLVKVVILVRYLHKSIITVPTELETVLAHLTEAINQLTIELNHKAQSSSHLHAKTILCLLKVDFPFSKLPLTIQCMILTDIQCMPGQKGD